MESRWYLFSGQTLDNTKISDRAHALHISKTAWDGITQHLDRKKRIQEALDKEIAFKKYLDDGSKNMTKSWENSLENVRRRKEEERLRLIEEKKAERQRKFFELRKEQEEIHARYMDKVGKQIFMTTGHARDLTSALIMSEVLYEREKQLEFDKKIKQHEKVEDLEYIEIQREKDEKAAKLEKEKQAKLIQKRKEYAEELKSIIKEKASFEKLIKEEKAKKEALDNIEAAKEVEKLEELLLMDKMAKKKTLYEEKKRLLEEQKAREEQRVKEEKELDEVIAIYRDAKHRIDCLKKQRERDLREAEVKRREKIATMVMAEQLDKSEAEERAIRRAVEEKEAAEMEKIKEKQEYQAKLRNEQQKYREEVQAREMEAQKKAEELKKWELLNRYKTDENMKKYEEEKRKKLWQQVLNYRQELCEQMNDVRLEQQREREIEQSFAESTTAEEDRKFFEYANEVLELARKKGRSTFPIERVVTKYVKEMNISPAQIGNSKESKSIELKDCLTITKKSKPCRCIQNKK